MKEKKRMKAENDECKCEEAEVNGIQGRERKMVSRENKV